MDDSLDTCLQRLSERLKLVRWRAELSQDVVAAKAGVTQRYYADLETGKRNTTLETLLRVASALDVSLGLLLDPAPEQTARELKALKKADPQPLKAGRKPRVKDR